ncbi:hypothetical protein ACIRPT_17025 [Streptomyces sp. NPDC101227]|uniref:hypothetical protein n=1 Tax=Streptomyces sp. NPDC101227 TaxID=3366136 RepID=UPI0037F5C29D
MKQHYRDGFRGLLQPGETLVEACDFAPNPALPAVPAELRMPARPSQWEQRVSGVFDSVASVIARPVVAVSHSRLANNRLTRALGRAAEAVSEARENAEDALDSAAERALWGQVIEGGWQSMAGRFRIHLAHAGDPTGLQAITDRRLIVALNRNEDRPNSAPQWVVAVDVPRRNIARFQANPGAVAARGRFDLVFADGSWIALGSALRRQMEQFVAACNGH